MCVETHPPDPQWLELAGPKKQHACVRVDKSKVGSSSRSARPHFWGLGAFQLLLAGGLAAYLLYAPTDQISQEPTSPVIASTADKLIPRPPARPEITGSIHSQGKRLLGGFATYDNRDMFGGDYDTIRDIGQAECERRCGSDQRCRAYTFNKWEKACFLKSSIGTVRLEPQGVTGVATSEVVKEDQRAPFIQKSRSRGFGGDPYKVLQSRGYEGCAAACLAETECLGFNFARSRRTCFLMSSSLGKPKSANAIDAGIKVQRSESLHRGARSKNGRIPPSQIPPEVAPIFDAVLRELAGH
jgi:hypothetical protein